MHFFLQIRDLYKQTKNRKEKKKKKRKDIFKWNLLLSDERHALGGGWREFSSVF